MTDKEQCTARDGGWRQGETPRDRVPPSLTSLEGVAGLELIELETVASPNATECGAFGELELAPGVDELVPYGAGELGGDAPLSEMRTRPDVRHPVRSPSPVANLTLAKPNIQRAQELRQAFASAADGAAVGEKLLEDLVAMEVGVALSLLDTEAAAVALLQQTLPVDPALALKIVAVAKEVEALSSAVHRRMQNGLAAAANLRAQRHLVSMQRGSHGK